MSHVRLQVTKVSIGCVAVQQRPLSMPACAIVSLSLPPVGQQFEGPPASEFALQAGKDSTLNRFTKRASDGRLRFAVRWARQIVFLAVAVPVWSAVAAPPQLVPHQAEYRVTLDTVRTGALVAAMTGTLQFEWRDVCDGWAVNQRFGLLFTDTRGQEHWSDRRYLTWEAKDGSAFRFSIRAVRNDTVTEEVEGEAVLYDDKSGGEIRFNMPSNYQAVLPEGTMFPSTHFLHILENLKGPQGPRMDVVFSGSEEDGLHRVNTFFGSEIDPGSMELDPQIDELFGRHVRIGYFPYFDQSLEPDYEAILQIRENGVLDKFVIDYADFSIKGVLDRWTTIQPGNC